MDLWLCEQRIKGDIGFYALAFSVFCLKESLFFVATDHLVMYAISEEKMGYVASVNRR